MGLLGRRRRTEEQKSSKTSWSWFRGARNVEQKGALACPSPDLLALFGAIPGASGIAITAETAMQVPAVACAVETIAQTVGSLCCDVYRTSSAGDCEPAPDHPVQQLLAREANPWTPSPLFIEQSVRDCLLHGDSVSAINRVDGRPQELIRLDPRHVVPRIGDYNEPFFTYAAPISGTQQIILAADAIHIRATSLDGVRGVAPIWLGREAIALGLLLEQHCTRLFANSAKPSGVLKAKKILGDAALTRLKASWNAAHTGSNAGGTAILEDSMDFQQLSLSSVDAQLLELRRFATAEIARLFRLPLHMLQELGRATWSNTEQLGREFLQYCLSPWLRRLEGEFRIKLFSADERAAGYHVRFDTDALLRADLAQRAESYSKLIASRVLSPNEAREIEGRPPYPGGEKFINPNTTTETVSVGR